MSAPPRARAVRDLSRAREHFLAGRLDKAESMLLKVLADVPGNADALEGLAYVAAKKGEFARAADWALRALQGAPASAPQYHAAASICQRAGRHEDAVRLYERSLELAPSHLPSYVDLAGSLAQLDRSGDALEMVDRAIALQPRLAELHYKRGWLLARLGRHEQEMAAYRTAIALQPDHVQAHVNLGVALRDLHCFEEALQQFDQAVAIDPQYPGAHTNRAQTRLLLGQFRAGWAEYEWRWQDGGPPMPFDAARLWTGEQPIAGRTVLLHFEQGFGDTLQFVRYVDVVAAKGARVILRVQDELLPLLGGYPAASTVIGASGAVPDYDLHCPLMSLPHACRLEDIPARVPYLQADAQKAQPWSARLEQATARPRVGIVWAGSRSHVDDRNRSMGFAQLAPLLAAEASFWSLQKDVPREDVEALHHRGNLVDAGAGLHSFADTAALISQLDLVISVDTAVAHLAGALGKPVWVALPFTPDWRWLLARADTPWYPHTRLFRQTVRGDWSNVVQELSAALADWPAR